MENLSARDIMSRHVVTVNEDLPVAELGRTLVEHGISGAPVLNNKGRLVGVVSATDIVANELKVGRTVVSEADFYSRPDIGSRAEQAALGMHVEDYADTLVRDIMTPIVIAVTPDATVMELADIMGVNRIHRVLVTQGEKLEGIVSALDLIALLRPEGLGTAESGG